ncbi:MAG: SLC13 family permease [Haliangiales bacterium]
MAVTAGIFVLLSVTRMGADAVFMLALTALLAGGVLSPEQALAGFAHPAVATIAALYVVVAALQETGAVSWLARRLLGGPGATWRTQLRLMAPVTALSAVLNNTPVVAMLIPAVRDFARKVDIAPSKLMIPLSYAAIAGGTCTLIGTSTNLVVDGMLRGTGHPGLGMFAPLWIGLPIASCVIGFVLASSRWLLPDRRSVLAQLDDDPRQYSIELVVAPDGPLVGKSIAEAGLRHLGSVFLAELDRAGRILPAVSPDEVLQGDDRLIFVGVVDSVLDLQQIRGLTPASDQIFKLAGARAQRLLFEAVVSHNNPLLGQSIRDGRFRSRYEAVVIALARDGARIQKKLGDIVLRAGDTLLLEARPEFAENLRNAKDFFLVSRIDDSHPPRFERAGIATGLLLAMILAVATGALDMFRAALFTAALLLLSRATSLARARRRIDWLVLVTIAAALGVGRALDQTGVAHAFAGQLIELTGDHPTLNLAAVFVATALISALMTNNAAAALMFPLAAASAQALGLDVTPYAITIMMAASASFATPMGYQTNLMVYGPGGYRFGDYLRVGLPLTALVGALTVWLVPLIWPLTG